MFKEVFPSQGDNYNNKLSSDNKESNDPELIGKSYSDSSQSSSSGFPNLSSFDHTLCTKFSRIKVSLVGFCQDWSSYIKLVRFGQVSQKASI